MNAIEPEMIQSAALSSFKRADAQELYRLVCMSNTVAHLHGAIDADIIRQGMQILKGNPRIVNILDVLKDLPGLRAAALESKDFIRDAVEKSVRDIILPPFHAKEAREMNADRVTQLIEHVKDQPDIMEILPEAIAEGSRSFIALHDEELIRLSSKLEKYPSLLQAIPELIKISTGKVIFKDKDTGAKKTIQHSVTLVFNGAAERLDFLDYGLFNEGDLESLKDKWDKSDTPHLRNRALPKVLDVLQALAQGEELPKGVRIIHVRNMERIAAAAQADLASQSIQLAP